MCFSFIGCKTVSIQNEAHQSTKQNRILGTIGEHKDFVLEQDYNNIAIPNYSKPIKLKANLIEFTSSTYKAYDASKVFQKEGVQIKYHDSLEQKPKFIKLEIADRLAVINALNKTDNQDIFQLLQHKSEAHLISSISVVFSDADFNAIRNADELFLESSGIKSYVISAYKNSQLLDSIHFNQGVVFAFQTSSACWKQNEKYQLKIIDLVESNDKCSKKSFRNSNRAKEDINYYKF